MIIRIILIALILICFNATAYAKYETILERNHYNNTYVELNHSGNNKEALEVLKEWAQKYPDDPTLYVYWGIQLREEGKNEEALLKFEKVAQLTPDSVGVYLDLGITLYTLGRYKEAKGKLEQYIKKFPDAYAYYYLGKTLYILNEYDEALKNFEMVPDTQPVDIDNTEIIEDSNKYVQLIKKKKQSITP